MGIESLSFTEENYIKAIFHLSENGAKEVFTNEISDFLHTKPASVTDMYKKLAKKNLIHHIKYQGVTLTETGKKHALQVVRKHRLWEVFLVGKLCFAWDEVHVVAEQLEHIQSPLLIKRLDEFLDFPQIDPHGDPIPNESGEMNILQRKSLEEANLGDKGVVISVHDTSAIFLQYLDKIGLGLESHIELLDRVEYDGSIEVKLNKAKVMVLSLQVAKNIYISC